MMKTKFFAERQQMGSRIAVYLMQNHNGPGPLFVAQPLVFHEQPLGEAHPEPTLSLTPDEAQSLMDELWGCGLRPTEGTGSAGALAATERHLADMRHLATKLLDKVVS